MELTNNFVIPARILPQPPPDEVAISVGNGLVYVINASSQNIQTITVDSAAVTLPAGGLEGVNLGTCANFVDVPRISAPSGPFFGPNSKIVVTFVGGSTWGQYVSLSTSRFPPSESVGVWCFYNGFIVSDMLGNMRQASW
jgi:hypothetical protein